MEINKNKIIINMTKIKLRRMVLFLVGILCCFFANAQESVNSSGGNATGSGGTVSYSIGQVIYTANIGGSGSVAQGVQHAYEILTVGINETALKLSLNAFPNPMADNLTLQIIDYNNEKMSYQLLDMHGKQLSIGEIIAHQTLINTASLPSATYFINVVNQENKKVQSFKIIKN